MLRILPTKTNKKKKCDSLKDSLFVKGLRHSSGARKIRCTFCPCAAASVGKDVIHDLADRPAILISNDVIS